MVALRFVVFQIILLSQVPWAVSTQEFGAAVIAYVPPAWLESCAYTLGITNGTDDVVFPDLSVHPTVRVSPGLAVVGLTVMVAAYESACCLLSAAVRAK